MVTVLAEDFEGGRIYQCTDKAYVVTIESAYVLEVETKINRGQRLSTPEAQSTLEPRSKLDPLRGRPFLSLASGHITSLTSICKTIRLALPNTSFN
jgi:hypothetical protein